MLLYRFQNLGLGGDSHDRFISRAICTLAIGLKKIGHEKSHMDSVSGSPLLVCQLSIPAPFDQYSKSHKKTKAKLKKAKKLLCRVLLPLYDKRKQKFMFTLGALGLTCHNPLVQ